MAPFRGECRTLTRTEMTGLLEWRGAGAPRWFPKAYAMRRGFDEKVLDRDHDGRTRDPSLSPLACSNFPNLETYLNLARRPRPNREFLALPLPLPVS